MAILDVREIMKILPHRYPMLLIDRVLELEPLATLRIRRKKLDRSPRFDRAPIIDAVNFADIKRGPRVMLCHYQVFAELGARVYPSLGIDVITYLQPQQIVKADPDMPNVVFGQESERFIA